jgi:glucokinase
MTGTPSVLVGDVGGTTTKLALLDEKLAAQVIRRYASREHDSLNHIVREFLSSRAQTVTHACFAIAGPVREGSVRTTNLPWVVEAADLARLIGVTDVLLINDIEAVGHGVGVLDESAFVTVHRGAGPTCGNAAVIAAGTGLGEAGLYWDGARHRPFASEGGHASFAPRDDLEMELLQFLVAEYGHVSWERVLSGPGLFNVYRFLRDSGRFDEPQWLAELIGQEDAAASIAQCALEGGAPICEHSLELFVSLYGAEAGNLTLKMMAVGGVYIAGGIAPKILDWLKRPSFRRAFVAKGRMQPLLETIPVRVVVSDRVGLLGAARAVLSNESLKAVRPSPTVTSSTTTRDAHADGKAIFGGQDGRRDRDRQ